jgi:hypothetical protein
MWAKLSFSAMLACNFSKLKNVLLCRKIEHGLKRDDPAHRRSYHLALGITSAVMYFAPKASKKFS